MSNGPLVFLLAHLSDLHATPVTRVDPRDLFGKRLLGWLSWTHRRRHEHRESVLEALLEDLAGVGADHVAVTGDLTQVGLPSEIDAAAAWLARIGDPDRVSLVPGNHDAYAPSRAADPWAPWAPYMTSRDAGGLDVGTGPGVDRFPFARRLGPLALVGISSAVPTGPLRASGRIGAVQCERLGKTLDALRAEERCRVVLMHHPPVPAGQSRRRQLEDAHAVRGVLQRAGAELVLHGHTHRSRFAALPGPQAAIPVVGVPSASSAGPRPERLARYHLYRIERDPLAASRGYRVSYVARGFDPASGRFVAVDEGSL